MRVRYVTSVPSDLGIQWLGHVYESKDTGAMKAEKLAAKLETLGPGLWEHIDHAATDDPENERLVLEVSRRFLQNKQPEKALDVLDRAARQPEGWQRYSDFQRRPLLSTHSTGVSDEPQDHSLINCCGGHPTAS